MASGIDVADEVVKAYSDFKTAKDRFYIVFKISDDGKQIVVDTETDGGPPKLGFSHFQDYFTKLHEAKKCRYAVVDFHFMNAEGQSRSKLIFVHFGPDIAKTKEKMMLASSKGSLKAKLEGASTEIQINDMDDLSMESFLNMKEVRGTEYK